MNRRDFISGAAVGGVVGIGATAAVMTSMKDAPAPKVAEAPVAAPAVLKDRLEFAMVTTWPRDFPGLGTGAQRFAERLSTLSDGRIQVEYFAAGERVGAFDSFDEVASGNAQGYHAADYYWKGKHPGWAYFTAVPFGLTYTEMNAWIRFGGGQELWDELGSEFGLKGLMCGNTGVQMGGWFNKEINTAEDLKGLKMRIPGLGGDVMAKLGASPVSLPGGQIYENLVSGAIDATEWVGPWNDQVMKFYEAAKFYYYPGMHEPGSMLAVGLNASFWGKLSPSDKLMIEAAASMENDVMMSEYNAKNGASLAQLINNNGVELRQFSDEIYDSFGTAADEVFSEVVAHSDLAARIHASFLKAREEVGGWTNISDQAYVAQRNRVLGL
ncbi:MAG: TRAP transporter substrate-binding protein [Alphaproteobacteria bacterium]|jgi:TRAP-type mannitol/chloroaromatic compound transport system substrate-binding protein